MVVSEEGESSVSTMYGFQFKRKSESENNAILAAIREASINDAPTHTLHPPGGRGRAMSYSRFVL